MLTLEELMTNQETKKHILYVRKYLFKIISALRLRGLDHDKSKREEPELSIFTKVTPKLAKMTYGSEEYKESLKEMGPALDHHYANNRHHPEFFRIFSDSKDMISHMNLIDLVEMFCDWKAATIRHDDGDLSRSIEINTKRFNLSPQLKSIFVNTIKILED